VPYSGALSLGITELVLLGAYFTWFIRIFVARVTPLPRIGAIEVLILFLGVAYLASIPGTKSPALGLHATWWLIVHALFYFYLVNHLALRHLPWMMLAFAVAIAMEASLGLLQAQYGMFPGLALDKGAGSEVLDTQYEVPGIEDRIRGTGTLYDSHALGLYCTMIGLFAFVLAYARQIVPWLRFLLLLLTLASVLGVVVSYSRSSWLVCVFGLTLATTIILFVWREREIIPTLFVAVLAVLPFVPWALDIIWERFANAPGKIMGVRFEQYLVAFRLWQENPFFGNGIGNYMYALREFNLDWTEELPVHNTVLWLAADTGAFGVVAFYSIVLVTALRLWRFVRLHHDPLCRFALAGFCALVTYALDGMSNPLFRDPVLFKQFWLMVALAGALPALREEQVRRRDAPLPGAWLWRKAEPERSPPTGADARKVR